MDVISSGAALDELKQLPDLLAERIDLARMLYRGVPTNVIFATDGEGRVILVDGDCQGVFGHEPEALRGQSIKALIPDRDLARVREHLKQRFVQGGKRDERPLTVYALRRDGTEIPVEILVTPYTVNRTTILFCAFREIGEVRAARAALGESHELLATIVDNLPAMVSAKDASGRYLLVNAFQAEVFGVRKGDVSGKSSTELLGVRGGPLDELDARLLAEGKPLTNHEESFEDADGRERLWLTSKVPLGGDGGSARKLVTISIDVTERQWDREKAEALINYDELTGLPNRSHFVARLHEVVAQSDRSGLLAAVLAIDLGRLGQINDEFGYGVGDYALRRAAIKLQTCVRETDTVARLGNDRFIVVQTNLNGYETADIQARRIIEALSQPMVWQGHEVRFDPRCGIAMFPENGRDARALMQNADLALGRAKAAGERVRYYLEGMSVEVQRRRELSAGLYRALERGHFELHYQPQLDMAGRPTGCEALIRWNDPDRGMISPGEFIPLAESSDLIIAMGQWVIEEACRQTKAWLSKGLPPITVAVNLSARQFQQPDLVDCVKRALDAVRLDPAWLVLEVTESAAMKDAETAASMLANLHDLGVGVAIDDFGTGYSSLAYLRRFQAHKVKLDRAFVRGVPGDPHNAAISTAVVQLCHSLGKTVVAEGVETQQQLDFLRRIQCDEAQGFLFSKALPAVAFEQWLRRIA